MQRHMGVAFELGLGPSFQVDNMQDSGWHFKRTQLPAVAVSIGHIYQSHQQLAVLITPLTDKLSRGGEHPVKNCDASSSRISHNTEMTVSKCWNGDGVWWRRRT